MFGTCQHCDKTRVLVARVQSSILDQIVCGECARLAARLVVVHEEDHPIEGELFVEVLEAA